MADNQFSELDDDLTGSWVELCHQSLPADTDTFSESIHNGNMEKLLMEAQQESCSSSQANSAVSSNRGSPKISNSPKEWATHEMSQGESVGTDWIWDWSSRPEIQPVGDLSGYFKHPRRHRLSVRNTKVLRNGVFCMENLPTLLISHACSFVLGAAVMFMYLKKYCNWAAVIAHHALD
ncbi:BCL2/adenovirus E1B 19 kDa protein-interacting protein 3-like [Octopus bimaculoides]|uniref:BCL2/adenovirus E1B 19 kDa protein-interacting protein 3-like n=1 Tax=Octopus bimaculoides TaxID=37653 RepID=UPI0022DF0D6F|nr:BCL2/adenovirus E1B 19 kDa protein-interacting protein 3-like [Octopus bimaculoides]